MSYQNILQFIVWYFEPVHTISLCTHKRTYCMVVLWPDINWFTLHYIVFFGPPLIEYYGIN